MTTDTARGLTLSSKHECMRRAKPWERVGFEHTKRSSRSAVSSAVASVITRGIEYHGVCFFSVFCALLG
jgi:hypothetical protein